MIIKVTDILHSNNGKGKYRESKVGEKYERRKNKTYEVDVNNLMPWGGLEMLEVVVGGKDNTVLKVLGDGIWTTEYKGFKVKGDDVEIYTWNSIYVGKLIKL